MQQTIQVAQPPTPRLVVAGCFGPRRIAIDIDPTFGDDDVWQGVMGTVIDAAPEQYGEELVDYILGDEEEWIRRGGS